MGTMNIFKIQQSPAIPGATASKAEPIEPAAAAAVAGGIAPIAEASVVTPTVVETPDVTNTDDGSSEKPEMMVKVDGPVGRVFTDALNRLLATEGYLTVLPKTKEMETLDTPDAPKKLVQVYCWRTDSVNVSDMVQLTNDITKHTDRQFVIAVEAASTLSSSLRTLDDLSKLPNVKVCFSNESAANFVKGLLK